MKREFLNICLFCGILLTVSVCRAENVMVPAKVIIDNPLQGSFLIGEIRNKDGFKANLRNSASKQTVVELNEKVLATNKLFLVFFDNVVSWIKVYPGDEIVVSQKDGLIITKGGNVKINQYLAKWTKLSYMNCPTSLLSRIAVMELAGVDYKQTAYKVDDYCCNTTVDYIKDLYNRNMADLKLSGITDKEFLEDQAKRIKFQWIELILSNYNSSEDNVRAAHLAALIKNHNLNDGWLLGYPGLNDMLGYYVKLKIKEGGLKIGAKSFLVDQASVFALQEMKETYILNELETIDRNHWYLFFEETLNLASSFIISDGGKLLLNKYRDNARKFITSETNLNNKPVHNFIFDDKKHKKVSLSDFRGKYVVIDFWATWCSPCKYQIPFLVKMQRAFRGKNVQFISVSVDKPEDREEWERYIEANDMNGICIMTPNALDFDFARKYSINTIPRFMIIDPDGEMIASEFRRPHDPVFKAQLEFLLSKMSLLKQ